MRCALVEIDRPPEELLARLIAGEDGWSAVVRKEGPVPWARAERRAGLLTTALSLEAHPDKGVLCVEVRVRRTLPVLVGAVVGLAVGGSLWAVHGVNVAFAGPLTLLLGAAAAGIAASAATLVGLGLEGGALRRIVTRGAVG